MRAFTERQVELCEGLQEVFSAVYRFAADPAAVPVAAVRARFDREIQQWLSFVDFPEDYPV
ncbi:MAG: hypothetical protein IT352_04065 [Gemmatimonadales bacterium]|nr:hypothetical protein [Gemmatimonadales bacterium]